MYDILIQHSVDLPQRGHGRFFIVSTKARYCHNVGLDSCRITRWCCMLRNGVGDERCVIASIVAHAISISRAQLNIFSSAVYGPEAWSSDEILSRNMNYFLEEIYTTTTIIIIVSFSRWVISYPGCIILPVTAAVDPVRTPSPSPVIVNNCIV